MDLAPLSAPVTKLIDVIAKGTGVLYEPTRLVREANARARAKLIVAEADRKVAVMQQSEALEHAKTEIALAEADVEIARRAAQRVYYTEMARQDNIERVIEMAIGELPPQVEPVPVDSAWARNFFTSVQDVSDADLQALWAKLLAGEVARPASYSRRTLDALKAMSALDARMVSAMFSLSFYSDGWGFYFSGDAMGKHMRTKIGDYEWQSHLIDIGIVTSEPKIWIATQVNDIRIRMGREYFFMMEGPVADIGAAPNKFALEKWIERRDFTQIGQQLSRIASGPKDRAIVEGLNAEWNTDDNGVSLCEVEPGELTPH